MIIKNLLTNWKTTCTGLGLVVGGIIHLIYSLKSHSLTEGDATTTVMALLTGAGFIAAGDANVPPPVPPPDTGNTPPAGVGKTTVLLFLLGALTLACLPVLTGCNTTQQTITYKSLYTVETTTTAAFDGYMDGVISGAFSTNGVPKVSRGYNDFQAAFLVALDAAQFNTNALAPSSLIVESQDLVNLINTVKGK